MDEIATKNLDNLGLVAGMCKELDIAGIIDRAVGQTAHNKHISFGQAVVCMILNGLGFVGRVLYLYSEYFEDKPLGHLLEREDITPEQIDDNLLGRALDKLFELGVTALFTKIAMKAVNTLGIKVKSLHLDSTSFHVDGEYNSEIKQEESRIKLVQGYSRDHRPELNQAVLQLITSNQGNLPLYMQAASGNSSDQTAFAEVIDQHIQSFKDALQNKYFVGDSALYTPKSLALMEKNKALFVTRVPSRLKESRKIIQSIDKESLIPIGDGYFVKEERSEYGGIAQRWVVIFSKPAHQRETKTLKKRLLKGSTKEEREFWHLTKQDFSCKKDGEKALTQFQSKLKYTEIVDAEIQECKKYRKPGRPTKGSSDKSRFKISGSISSSLSKKETIEKGILF